MKKKAKKEFELRQKQKAAFIYLTHPDYWHIKNVAFGGAAGGGKSVLAAAWMIHMCTQERLPNLYYAACAYDIEKAEASIMNKINEVAEMMGFKKDLHYTYNKKKHTFTFLKTGSRIIMFGLPTKSQDKENNWLRGYEFTGAWIDESDTVDEKVIRAFQKRLGRAGNTEWVPMENMTDEEKLRNPDWKKFKGYDREIVPAKLFETFNPSHKHVYERFFVPWRDNTEKDSIFIRSYIYDNYPTGHPYLISAENEPEGPEKEKMFYGSFDYNDSPEALFVYQSVVNMFDNKLDDTEGKYCVIDVSNIGADKDKTTVSIWRGLECYFLIDIDNIDTTEQLIETISDLLRRHNVPVENMVIDANGVGNMLIHSEKFKGAKAFIAHNSVIREETGLVNSFKKNKNVLAESMKGRHFKLKDQCTMLLADMVNNDQISATFDNDKLREYLKIELLNYRNINKDSDVIMVTTKAMFRKELNRSPDTSDLFVMRMYLELLDKSIKKARPLSERKFIKKKVIKSNYV
jgi:phage terminase large subunit